MENTLTDHERIIKLEKQVKKLTSNTMLPASISKNEGGVLKIYLEVDGYLPKYLKRYTDGEAKGEIYQSEDNKEFTKTEIKWTSVYEFVYKHISGSDREHWMLWELRAKEDFLKYCR